MNRPFVAYVCCKGVGILYDIMCNGVAVGKASVKREGLYYCIHYKCNLPQKGIFRVMVTESHNTYDLGICVPDGDVYSGTTRIPCKRFYSNDLVFTLMSDDKIVCVPIMGGEPFLYLDKLNAARLCNTNGQLEIIINPIQVQPDSDRNRKYQNK